MATKFLYMWKITAFVKCTYPAHKLVIISSTVTDWWWFNTEYTIRRPVTCYFMLGCWNTDPGEGGTPCMKTVSQPLCLDFSVYCGGFSIITYVSVWKHVLWLTSNIFSVNIHVITVEIWYFYQNHGLHRLPWQQILLFFAEECRFQKYMSPLSTGANINPDCETMLILHQK